MSFDLQGEQPRQKIAGMGDAGVRMEVQELQGSAASAVEALGDSLTWSSDEFSRGPLLTLILLKVTFSCGLAGSAWSSIRRPYAACPQGQCVSCIWTCVWICLAQHSNVLGHCKTPCVQLLHQHT